MLRGSRALRKIAPAAFYGALAEHGHTSYYGVPDSLLKDLCAFITDTVSPQNHVITCNEGSAVAMAAGHHMATGKIGVVYMQNSGVGNTINPLLSLAHKEVYQIPMLKIIGWRGDPEGKPDEPQHKAQGRLMKELLDATETPFAVLGPDDDMYAAKKALDDAHKHFKHHSTPFAILIKRDTFSSYKMAPKPSDHLYPLTREHAINTILSHLGDRDIVVSTTGMPSREVFEARAKKKAGHHRDFLTVGAMGHCSSIAAGIALSKPERNVFVIDGDGAAIMHLGACAINGSLNKQHPDMLCNFKHIIVNNGAHDSVGGQPTVAMSIDLSAVAAACKYKVVTCAENEEDLITRLKELQKTPGPAMLEVKVRTGNRPDLGRPTTTTHKNKEDFMGFLL